jgi:hypothetical protein
MTDRREERRIKLQQLKDGKMSPKQKADFYFKMAKIVERELDRLAEITDLLDVIPNSYLKNIDFSKASMSVMKLTESLVEATDPSPYASRDADGKHHIYRHYMVNLAGSVPMLGNATASVDVSYEATLDEVKFFSRLIDHIVLLEEMYRNNERPNKILSLQEMEKKIKFAVKGRPYTARFVGLTGFPVDHDAIMKGDKPLHEILPDMDKIDLRDLLKEPPK